MGDSIGNAGVVGETNYANLIARIQKLESTQKVIIYIYHISIILIYTVRLITNFSRDHIKVM